MNMLVDKNRSSEHPHCGGKTCREVLNAARKVAFLEAGLVERSQVCSATEGTMISTSVAMLALGYENLH